VQKLGLAPEVEGDDKIWRFVGIWAKNRWEWLVTHIGQMYTNNTTIGFFDSMGLNTIDFILNQTELTTIFTSAELLPKILELKQKPNDDNEQRGVYLKTVVCFDKVKSEQKAAC